MIHGNRLDPIHFQQRAEGFKKHMYHLLLMECVLIHGDTPVLPVCNNCSPAGLALSHHSPEHQEVTRGITGFFLVMITHKYLDKTNASSSSQGFSFQQSMSLLLTSNSQTNQSINPTVLENI